MQVQLRKVPGGFELFIPDELAAEAGLAEGQPTEATVLADQLMVSNPEFVRAAREAFYAGVTPETLHTGPDEWTHARPPAQASE